MATLAIEGTGAEFRRGDGASSEAFTKINEVVSIDLPGMQGREIDVSHLDSGVYDEFIMGGIDPGEATLILNWRSDTWQDFYDDMIARTTDNYQLALPNDALVLTFAGYVKSVPFETIQRENAVRYSVTLRLTGAYTIES
jgi:hypothetical protein